MNQLTNRQSKVVGVIIDEWHTSAEISGVTGLSTSEVTNCIWYLKKKNIVEKYIEGRTYWYRFNPEGVVNGGVNPDLCHTCPQTHGEASHTIKRGGIKYGVCPRCVPLYNLYMTDDKLERRATNG